MPDGYPSDKPYLVIKITRDRHLIPKKTFDDWNDALQYVEKHSDGNYVNLHENPAWSSDPVNLDDIREFVHGTREW
jgi:hypothetical protein